MSALSGLVAIQAVLLVATTATAAMALWSARTMVGLVNDGLADVRRVAEALADDVEGRRS